MAVENVSQVGSVWNPLPDSPSERSGLRLSSQGDMGPQTQPDSRRDGCWPLCPPPLLGRGGLPSPLGVEGAMACSERSLSPLCESASFLPYPGCREGDRAGSRG